MLPMLVVLTRTVRSHLLRQLLAAGTVAISLVNIQGETSLAAEVCLLQPAWVRGGHGVGMG